MVARFGSWVLLPAFLSFMPQSGSWPRVNVPDPVGGMAIRQALDNASRWVENARCRLVLTDFADGAGRPLADRLETEAIDFQSYLRTIVFVDGSRQIRCAGGALAFTEPGSRVVHVCVDRLKETWSRDRKDTVASMIHEALHTLGLGENPPSPKEITSRVLARCAI